MRLMNLIRKIHVFIVAVILFIPATLWAADNFNTFEISNIKVEGLERISLGTVLNYVPVKVGDTMTESASAKTLRELYETGFFQNVALERSGNTLIIEVVERATIGKITVSGNSSITKEQMDSVLAQMELVKGHVYQRSSLEQLSNQLKQEYNNRGKYNATIDTKVTKLSENRVGIDVTISEGRSSRIKEINIIGNHAFTDSELLDEFSFRTIGFLTYFTSKDQYSKEEMNASMEALRSYYMNRGYVRFHIDSTQVLLSPDKKYVYIDIKITEGAKYTFSGYALTGHLFLPKEQLEKLVLVKKDDTFSRQTVTNTVTALSEAYANVGYGFPKITPKPVINDKDKNVFINFVLHPGRHVYVRRINFTGNTKTGDYVLRRTIQQSEGGLLTLANIKESERKLRMLGYLKNVNVKTIRVPDTNNQVDLDVHAEEGPSAEASVGIGWGSNGPELNAGVNQKNFMGTGRDVGLHFATNYYSTSYVANYYNPFYTDSGIGRGVKAYFTQIDPSNLDLATYTNDKMGLDVNYNIPLTTKSSMQAGYGFQHVDITSMGNPVISQVQAFTDENGSNFNELKLNSGWGRNSYDRAIFPTQGTSNQAGLTLSLPATASSLTYYKANYNTHLYQPLFKGFILTASGALGYGDTLDSNGLPVYENYFAGGISQPGQVRGYENYSLGPKDSNDNTLGGNFLTAASVGLILPNPLSQPSFRTTTFIDAGNVYSYNLPEAQQGTDSGPLRYSAGLAVDWRSPMGPLSFSLATPLNQQDGDVSNPFQFTVSSML